MAKQTPSTETTDVNATVPQQAVNEDAVSAEVSVPQDGQTEETKASKLATLTEKLKENRKALVGLGVAAAATAAVLIRLKLQSKDTEDEGAESDEPLEG